MAGSKAPFSPPWHADRTEGGWRRIANTNVVADVTHTRAENDIERNKGLFYNGFVPGSYRIWQLLDRMPDHGGSDRNKSLRHTKFTSFCIGHAKPRQAATESLMQSTGQLSIFHHHLDLINKRKVTESQVRDPI
jgi:hypothetical protein